MEKSTVKIAIFDIIKCVVISLLISMVLVLILALIAKYAAFSDNTLLYINQAIKVISVLFGTFFGMKGRKGGLITGAIIGLLYIVFSFLIFALISRDLSLKNITIYDFLIGIGVGILSGVLTVNIKSMRKPLA